MPDTLPVHVNRASLHSLEVADRFETDDSFEILLINHGEPTHVHLHVDDALSELASIEAPNHHVERESERRVRVTVHSHGSTFGKLKIATSYGAETRYVDVDIDEPIETEEPVQVDESLSKPQPRSDGRDDATGVSAVPWPLLALGLVAVALALVVAAWVGGTAAWLGAFVVVAAVAVATALAVGE
ncbi:MULTISPECIES: DUF7524 family protein [Halomicrobium]|uniref:Uncharacterized protein n=1 Tax=Halomicrobium mukohataei TaxID=57705 RepID=A0A4D6KG13_9EURY|nr:MULTISPECIES: hypothetical protein [Halomicrobium]QCD66707.1 hypothetical protein E5139_14025 [Halomicrobium mukohataei]QFR21513.1 hypothetical protein GBQ70_14040 [Halomicrobium sp. ZPS1]